MFEKKLVGALQSPALVADLKRYQRKLAREKMRRWWLLLFTLLLLGLQYVPFIINPPNAVTTEAADLISGGFNTKQDVLLAFDNQNSSFYHLASALGLKQADLKTLTTRPQAFIKDDGVEWVAVSTYYPSNSSVTFEGPLLSLALADHATFYGYPVVFSKQRAQPLALVGYSKTVGEFSVLARSGGIVTSWEHARAVDTCYKQPDKSLSYLHCPNGVNLTTTTEVENTTRHRDARFVKARPSDSLSYRLSVHNHDTQPAHLTPEIYVGDISQYVTIENTNGGIYDNQKEVITWPRTSVLPQGTATYSFTARVADPLPLSPRSQHDLNSYDCRLTTYFGGSHTVSLLCPTPKVVEFLLHQPFSVLFVAVLWFALLINAILLLRTYLFYKELNLIFEDMRKA